MPPGYDLKCNNCGNENSVVSYYLSVVIDGQDKPLAHPGEGDVLKEKYNYTMDVAGWSGLLRQNYGYICKSCGSTNYIKSFYLPEVLLIPFSGVTKVFYILTVIILGCLLFAIELNHFFIVILVVIYAIVFTLFLNWIKKKKTLKKYSFPVNRLCENCGSTELVELWPYLKDKTNKVLCSKCDKREMTCESTWLS
jgi:hypothetical protein